RCAERTQITRGLDHCLICNRLVGQPGQLCPNDRTATGLTGLQSYGNYREPSLRRAIHYLKYQGVWAAAPHLGAVARARLGPILALPWRTVVPVPLSSGRWRERGFNQAELLAKAFNPRPSANPP